VCVIRLAGTAHAAAALGQRETDERKAASCSFLLYFHLYFNTRSTYIVHPRAKPTPFSFSHLGVQYDDDAAPTAAAASVATTSPLPMSSCSDCTSVDPLMSLVVHTTIW
jgi:hypothetical protein